ncbi:MAG: transposase [Taibaiella sp.]|nr:transposase [Taibaiella sp.]
MLTKYNCTFFTATILEWNNLLTNERYKDIVIDSLNFLVDAGRAYIHGFVIMNNHLHLIWHIREPHKPEYVQRDFLRYTAKMILKDLKENSTALLEPFIVNAKDRKYQIWERNALSTAIWNEDVLKQKLNYIHQNPIRKNLCVRIEDYKYSSGEYYTTGKNNYRFLTHYRY